MKLRIVPIYLWLLAGLMCARADVITARSFSGQFTARELRGFVPLGREPEAHRINVAGGWAFLLNPPPAGNPTQEEVTLEPSLLVVSCERLKSALLTDLALADNWNGPVNINIHPDWKQDQKPVLTAKHSLDGWSYQLDFPKFMGKQILVRALMQTLLVELANRDAGAQSAEVPFWLVEGLSVHLQAFSVDGFILQPSLEMTRVRLQGLDLVRDQLRRHQPLSFQRLSWPLDSDLTDGGLQLYRSCAQLFVEDLLEFRDGRLCLQSMLRELPRHLNWQTAFLTAFHPHFNQLLDVEKWWSLSCVEFLRDDISRPWSEEDCWKKLQDALDVPVQVHFASNQMPAEAAITLQEAIAQWPETETKTTLRRTIGDLEILHYRAPASLRRMVDMYLQTLVAYAEKNSRKSAIAQLDALDKERYAVLQRKNQRILDK